MNPFDQPWICWAFTIDNKIFSAPVNIKKIDQDRYELIVKTEDFKLEKTG